MLTTVRYRIDRPFRFSARRLLHAIRFVSLFFPLSAPSTGLAPQTQDGSQKGLNPDTIQPSPAQTKRRKSQGQNLGFHGPETSPPTLRNSRSSCPVPASIQHPARNHPNPLSLNSTGLFDNERTPDNFPPVHFVRPISALSSHPLVNRCWISSNASLNFRCANRSFDITCPFDERRTAPTQTPDTYRLRYANSQPRTPRRPLLALSLVDPTFASGLFLLVVVVDSSPLLRRRPPRFALTLCPGNCKTA